jgi:hypothetical protein
MELAVNKDAKNMITSMSGLTLILLHHFVRNMEVFFLPGFYQSIIYELILSLEMMFLLQES